MKLPVGVSAAWMAGIVPSSVLMAVFNCMGLVSMNEMPEVPRLTTATTLPLRRLEQELLNHRLQIEGWLRAQWLETPAPFYASVDIRNAGFKLSPVDTNLFPAGFNNLNRAFLPLCIQAAEHAVQQVRVTTRNILIIPESHTRNRFYLESVATLQEVLSKAGFAVRIGSLQEGLEQPMEVALDSGRSVLLEPLIRTGRRVGVQGFEPCLVLLNNDFSGGHPEILEHLEQPVVPPLALGWASRLKSDHFAEYRRVCLEFSRLTGIDSWLVDPLFRDCGEVNFMKREGEDCLVETAADLLREIQQKYDEHDIRQAPFVVVKADAGTYGMGIMTVRDAAELRELNRKQRTRMAAAKGGAGVSRVILQEGVYSFETWGEHESVAEPVVYMMDRFVVGGFYRVHTERGVDENLNAPGMHFEPLSFVESCNNPDADEDVDAYPNRFYAYGVIARLALLAAARELDEHELLPHEC